jgi:glycopeptide antibiotics resistance protein
MEGKDKIITFRLKKLVQKENIRNPALMVIYMVYLFILTMHPYEFSGVLFKEVLNQDFGALLRFILYFDVFDILNNFLLFIPFGILLFFLITQLKREKQRFSLWIPVLSAAVISSSIESAQLFLPDRSASVIDIIANTCGALIGFCCISRWQFAKRGLTKISRMWKRFSLRLVITIIYGISLLVLFSIPLFFNNFQNWDEKFHLHMGNEATLDRPWEGEIFLVALYDRALSQGEIRRLYQRGTMNPGVEERRKCGAQVLYTFSEKKGSHIHDQSHGNEPLDMYGDMMDWKDRRAGVGIKDGGILKSLKPGEKIVRAFKQSSQMTVEIWLRVDDLNQTGPARIVSLSHDTDQRNFTLGQDGHDMHFRVRTPLTGPNGSWINLISRDVLNDQKIHHIAATFNRGVSMMLLDGEMKGGYLRGDVDYLLILLKFGRNKVTRLSFLFIVILPFGFLVYTLFSRRRFFLTVLFCTSLVIFREVAYYFFLGQPLGLEIVMISILIKMSGAWLSHLHTGITDNKRAV